MKWRVLLGVLLIASPVWAGQVFNPFTGKPDKCATIQETDGSPSSAGCQTINVTNGTLTDNGDGTFALSTGGSSGNSFETISTPAGTSPVADSATDTLTITETSFLTITGTAATDTIDITQVTTDIGTDGLIAANAVALGTDTTNNYVATVADDGTSTVTVVGSGSETAAVTLKVIDVSCTDCLGTTEIADSYVLNTGDVMTGDLDIQATGPDIRLSPTGGDVFHFGAESGAGGGVAFISNVTDGFHYLRFTGADKLQIPSLLNCDTVDTTADGTLVCGTDTGGAGSGDVTDVGDCSTGACFTSGGSGTSLDVAAAGVRLTGSAGTLTFLGLGTGADENLVMDLDTTSNTVIFSSGTGITDFLLSGVDLVISAVDPTFELRDTVGDAFEFFSDNSQFYVRNKTDGISLLQWNASNKFTFRGSGVSYTWPSADGTDGQVLSTNGSGVLRWDTSADKEFVWPMPSLLPLEAADSIPPLAKDAGTNVDMLVVDFDPSTDECRTVQFLAPPDITTGGTVTFTVVWYAASVTTGNVMWDFRHNSGVADGVDPDAALTTEAASACTAPGTAGQVDVCTWTETQTNLAWAASDTVVGVICRDANNASDTFSADARAILFGIRIPRS